MSGLSNMTDRELLVQIHTEMKSVKSELERVAPEVRKVESRVTKLETRSASNNKIIAVVVSVATSLITVMAKGFIDKY